MKPFDLPETFMLGVATASAQIEGGDTNNSWYRWSHQKGNIADGTNCGIADDHWNRIDEDIELMKQMNIDTYRLSLEWSRIEPEKEKFSRDAINHYRDEIIKLKNAGIIPLITLHHFSNPLWLEDSGGWMNNDVVRHFCDYAEYAFNNLGDLVSDWVTINEPNVYLIFGYVYGTWPPGKQSIRMYFNGAKNMIASHIAVYKKIHALASEKGLRHVKVGTCHHLRIFQPKNKSFVEKTICSILERVFHDIFITGMAEGKLLWPLGSGYPFGRGDYQDFFGINYYTRDIVSFNPLNFGQLFSETEVMEGAPVNDLGWEIYPDGLYTLCARYYDRFKKPVFITENGTCDKSDAFRTKYIYDHILQVKKLCEAKVDVQRYYHWTLMDNFEWAEGLSARFGLIDVDYDTQKRHVRKSGHFFRDICVHRGITQDMIEEYLK
ncbi:MAG: glycoside hydrolase family 1 protein [Deltaproteobacteria bacterium]|nr:glycoside hydrolase family 1 protein [Deltaproteobacteria bacterium]MBW2179057.1 glycoside hydrolase family 1 protein [Deltaproteobacteria bacterium]